MDNLITDGTLLEIQTGGCAQQWFSFFVRRWFPDKEKPVKPPSTIDYLWSMCSG